MNVVDNYFAARESLFYLFSYDGGWGDLYVEENNNFWQISGDQLYWGLTEENSDEYCSEIVKGQVYRSDDYLLVMVESDFGSEKYFMIFKREKEINEA